MKLILIFVTLLWSLTFAGTSSAVKPDLPEVERVQKAFEKLVRSATDADWRAVAATRKELAGLGQEAVPRVTEAARSHGDARVRRACYELLTNEFAKDERAVDTVIEHGLTDQDPGIRYGVRLLLGDLKVHRADRALRAAFGSRNRE